MPPRGQPVLPDYRTPRASADSKGVHRPMFSKLPFRGGLLPAVGGEPEAQALPPSGAEAGPEGGSPQYRSRLSARVDEMSPSATPPGSRYPDGSRFGQPIRLVSPAGAAAYLSEPSGFPRTAQVSPAYATAIIRVPQPVRPSRPAVPPLAGSYHASTPV
jgi:hypothetical protein